MATLIMNQIASNPYAHREPSVGYKMPGSIKRLFPLQNAEEAPIASSSTGNVRQLISKPSLLSIPPPSVPVLVHKEEDSNTGPKGLSNFLMMQRLPDIAQDE